jgi:mercuric ion binding protein
MRVALIAIIGALASALTLSPIAVSFARATAPAPTSVSEQKVTFVIENMSCALCPVTVKTAMERVSGVKSVQIDFKAKTATVTFDPSVTTAEAIAAASTNAGYPARPASN